MTNLLQNQSVKFSQKITLLICAFLLCLVMTTMLNSLILALTGADSLIFINISILTQNILAFILPVAITMAFITTKPLQFLQLDTKPTTKSIIMMFAIYIAMTPAMNYLVDWNANITLPESMKAIETWMKASENAASAVTDRILNQNNILLSILLVGVLTGLSEEILFRGGLQQILATRPMNIHLAIWISAFIFSAIHFQFFGFFPRLFLGALFGYFAFWSGSLWTAIIAHAVNNSTVIIAHAINNSYGYNLDSLGLTAEGEFPIIALLSLIITATLIYLYPKHRKVIS